MQSHSNKLLVPILAHPSQRKKIIKIIECVPKMAAYCLGRKSFRFGREFDFQTADLDANSIFKCKTSFSARWLCLCNVSS